MDKIRLSVVVTLVCSVAKSQADLIDIGTNRPEGIHFLPTGAAETIGLDSSGIWALVSEFYYGGIQAVNIKDGSKQQIVDSTAFGERATVGLWYDDGTIFACGGGTLLGDTYTASMYAFDAATGNLLATCNPDGAGFVNDVTLIGDTAYVTDSLRSDLLVIDAPGMRNGECNYYWIPLTDPFPPASDDVTANGECIPCVSYACLNEP